MRAPQVLAYYTVCPAWLTIRTHRDREIVPRILEFKNHLNTYESILPGRSDRSGASLKAPRLRRVGKPLLPVLKE